MVRAYTQSSKPQSSSLTTVIACRLYLGNFPVPGLLFTQHGNKVTISFLEWRKTFYFTETSTLRQ